MTTVDTRGELLSLLTEACELEHGLACSYLFAAFSLKQELGEGIDWREQQITRRWAAQVYFVASQEMSHLAQVWNLLTAIGGTPYYARPNMPLPERHYPLGLKLELLPYSIEALERFVAFEKPENEQRALAEIDHEFDYDTVGELYRRIAEGFTTIDEKTLFIGDSNAQCGPEAGHFRELVPVTDRDSALRGIRTIREQGEGTPNNHNRDCHFAIFEDLRDEFASRNTELARPVVENPAAHVRPDQIGQRVTPITATVTKRIAELFDDLYGTMLRMLAHAFADHRDAIDRVRWACTAIDLMVTAVKPLGEAVTLLPVRDGSTRRAGPAFGLTRHIPLPSRPDLARAMMVERLLELRREASAAENAVREQYGATIEGNFAAGRLVAVCESTARAAKSL